MARVGEGGVSEAFPFFLFGCQFGAVGFTLAAQTSFLGAEGAEMAALIDENLSVDERLADCFVFFVRELLAELAAADGVNAQFE